jgi:hypothetical protein
MLYALRQPATLLGLVLGFAAGCILRVVGQKAANGGLRSLRYGGLRQAIEPRSWLDPFGVVAALLAGAGWSPRPQLAFRAKGRAVWVMTVVAVVAHGLMAAAGLAAYAAVGGHLNLLQYISPVSVLHGSQPLATSTVQRITLGFGIENLGCGLLALVPLPPLELGVAVWSTLPRSAGARQLAFRFLEEQWAIVIVLVLLILPIAGEQPLLLQLFDSLGSDILQLL